NPAIEEALEQQLRELTLLPLNITILSQTPWLMLFRMQGESFLCLEPQSHPVNAHNMDGQPGLRVLGAGEKLNFSLKIIIEGA
ncbi:hypothetical protein RUW48_00005, partial [Klebsiella pneumoniae]|nr:hypothetical protein [Klebsiella pneumoniae]